MKRRCANPKSRAVHRTLLPAVALLLGLSTIVVAQGPRLFSREWYAQFSGPYSQPVEPFRIVGNIYYVGARNIAAYLIATPQGHILIDTGMSEMHDAITSGVERLGYTVSDIRILLASHAHFDHIDGHAPMQRRTGAQVMAMSGDAEALETGHDNLGARGDRLGAGAGVAPVEGRRYGHAGWHDAAGHPCARAHSGRDDLENDGGR